MEHLIIDTDIGADCDDAGALAIACNAHTAGAARLVAVTLCTVNPYAAGAASAVCRYYGVDVPLGQTRVRPPQEGDAHFETGFAKALAGRIENADYYPRGAVRPSDAVAVLRKALAESAEPVTVVAIGPCTNLSGLLHSRPEGYSPLSGVELIETKCRKLVLMGGFFPQAGEQAMAVDGNIETAEFNIRLDVPAAQTVFATWPTAIDVVDFSVGRRILTGGILLTDAPDSPTADAYRIYANGDRESWDPIAVYWAVYGADGTFETTSRGTVTVDDAGITTFSADPLGRHALVYAASPAAALRLNAAMLAALGRL